MHAKPDKIKERIGLPPGTPVYNGKYRNEPVSISLINYNEKSLINKESIGVDECLSFKDSPSVTWININGIYNTDIVLKIAEGFKLHPMLVEDVLDTAQRPKMEDFGDYMLIIFKMIYYSSESNNSLTSEHVSLVLGKNFVISFQEKEGDVFNSIRDRIKNSRGRIRKMNSDYLVYSVLDAVIDTYFLVIEQMGSLIEDLEDALIKNPDLKAIKSLHNLKRSTIYLKKAIWPMREVISSISRSETHLISQSAELYFRDLYDHIIQVVDSIESFRDLLSGIMDIYLSSLSNKMNEVMKTLTVIATIFIPLTFIAGIYGMNFKFMPELDWKYGYPSIITVMVLVVIIMLAYFKRKKWM